MGQRQPHRLSQDEALQFEAIFLDFMLTCQIVMNNLGRRISSAQVFTDYRAFREDIAYEQIERGSRTL